jgi:glyoxylase-like metal-dependent hydrolase (beta-lactamase superfamily II)
VTVPSATPIDRVDSPPPIVTGEPVEVSSRVFVIPDNRVSLVPNVGIVVGDRAGLVIDTGLGPRNGAHVLHQARRLLGDRPLYLAITQFDPGHGFGTQAFKGAATIVLGAPQRDRLHNHAASYVDTFVRFSPAAAHELEGVEFVEPDVVFDGRLEIDLGSVSAVLRSWGPAHTSDDQTVLVDDRVLFGGDLFATRMFPIVPYFAPFDTHFDGDRWISALDELMTVGSDVVVVPGHGEPTDRNQIVEVRAYLDHIRAQSRRLRASGASVEVAATMIERNAVATWSDWETPHWIGYLVRAFYAEER